MSRLPRSTGKSARRRHPFLNGNFAPVHTELPLTPCTYTGTIPDELVGGQYVRNGGNSALPDDVQDETQHFHWFDGDGMLAGVFFRRGGDGRAYPEFVNAHVLTDVFLFSDRNTLQRPLVPSIGLFVDPLASLCTILFGVMRTWLLVFLSWVPGFGSPVRKISASNTAVLYHDGRALATCESGPPMRFMLPGLETVGWFDGIAAEGEDERREDARDMKAFGEEDPILGWMKEWTTAHPRVDPYTNEMLLFHSIPVPPYMQYSIVPPTSVSSKPYLHPRLTNVAVPGFKASKISHDFGATLTHTILLDLPLHLTPSLTEPMLSYNPSGHVRFSIFPRHSPQHPRWFDDTAGGACCILHVAAAWNSYTLTKAAERDERAISAVNFLACRMNAASLLYIPAGLAVPPSADPPAGQPSRCELYYWSFDLHSSSTTPLHAFALSAVPFEFPTVAREASMGRPLAAGGEGPQYAWGTSLRCGAFGAALGRTTKVDAIARLDVHALVARGIATGVPNGGCVDARDAPAVIAGVPPPYSLALGEEDPVRVFPMPEGWYAQEPTFVPRHNGDGENDGWILFYAFDESQLGPDGLAPPEARSELWVLDAKNMIEVVARVLLPQRVPYGLHGEWFSEGEIHGQKVVARVRVREGRNEPQGWFVRCVKSLVYSILG